MRVVSINVNGIRAAARKGMFPWLQEDRADIYCLQEVRAQTDQIKAPEFWPEGYHCYYHSGERKGYAGVAMYSRQEPDEIIEGLGWPDMDAEGRYLEARFGDLSVVSLYVPSGSSSDERQAIKFDFLGRFMPYLESLRASDRRYIICGDWNIAHKQIDLKNWRSNQKNSGFLPEERAWMDQLFGAAGFVDAFRAVNPEPDQYTWWSNRGQAWANNTGWRIDYQVVSPELSGTIRSASIYKAERFSDHAPLTLEYGLDP